MIQAIVAAFIVGYIFIALESVIKVNKAAVALLMCVVCWTIFAVSGLTEQLNIDLNEAVERNLGEAGSTLFFLMGAMTIVELVDQHGGFNFVRRILKTKSKRSLLWKIACMTALMSAMLDNLTTSIVMIMILRKMVKDQKDRIWFASCVIIAANAGGAFSPIGDVTTIMLWNGKMITAGGVISEIIIPSIIAFVLPTAVIQYKLSGNLDELVNEKELDINDPIVKRRKTILILGVGGLCCVPVFHTLTELPAFIGILCVLGIMWCVTEFFYRKHDDKTAIRVTQMLARIDMSTILFFLGILMAVSVLSEVGVLTSLGSWLEDKVGNCYLITGVIGVLSSIVDNVPLVAGSMKMYAIDPVAGSPFCEDGIFWQLLAYCAGVGGSILIIGSAAGVVVMGLEKISFGWYMKNISWIAFLGYLGGIVCYWLEKMIVC